MADDEAPERQDTSASQTRSRHDNERRPDMHRGRARSESPLDRERDRSPSLGAEIRASQAMIAGSGHMAMVTPEATPQRRMARPRDASSRRDQYPHLPPHEVEAAVESSLVVKRMQEDHEELQSRHDKLFDENKELRASHDALADVVKGLSDQLAQVKAHLNQVNELPAQEQAGPSEQHQVQTTHPCDNCRRLGAKVEDQSLEIMRLGMLIDEMRRTSRENNTKIIQLETKVETFQALPATVHRLEGQFLQLQHQQQVDPSLRVRIEQLERGIQSVRDPTSQVGPVPANSRQEMALVHEIASNAAQNASSRIMDPTPSRSERGNSSVQVEPRHVDQSFSSRPTVPAGSRTLKSVEEFKEALKEGDKQAQQALHQTSGDHNLALALYTTGNRPDRLDKIQRVNVWTEREDGVILGRDTSQEYQAIVGMHGQRRVDTRLKYLEIMQRVNHNADGNERERSSGNPISFDNFGGGNDAMQEVEEAEPDNHMADDATDSVEEEGETLARPVGRREKVHLTERTRQSPPSTIHPPRRNSKDQREKPASDDDDPLDIGLDPAPPQTPAPSNRPRAAPHGPVLAQAPPPVPSRCSKVVVPEHPDSGDEGASQQDEVQSTKSRSSSPSGKRKRGLSNDDSGPSHPNRPKRTRASPTKPAAPTIVENAVPKVQKAKPDPKILKQAILELFKPSSTISPLRCVSREDWRDFKNRSEVLENASGAKQLYLHQSAVEEYYLNYLKEHAPEPTPHLLECLEKGVCIAPGHVVKILENDRIRCAVEDPYRGNKVAKCCADHAAVRFYRVKDDEEDDLDGDDRSASHSVGVSDVAGEASDDRSDAEGEGEEEEEESGGGDDESEALPEHDKPISISDSDSSYKDEGESDEE